MKKTGLLAIIFCCASLIAPREGAALEKSTNPTLRVCILDDRDNVSLAARSSYKIYSLSSDKILTGGYFLNAKVKATPQGIVVGRREFKFSGIRIKVPENAHIYVDGRLFRGTIDIIRKDTMKLMVVNQIMLEDYLYGVLTNEVSHRWPLEAIKAQAIVARTFALYQVRQNKLQDYDLRSDIYSQVYSGKTSERWATTRAVNLTRGEVVTYKGDIFPAYYHATCAGYTEDASNLWNVDMAPLKGVECNFCTNSPHYKWTKLIFLWEIETKLKENGYRIGKPQSMAILSRNSSGRVDKIEIKDDAGVSCILTGKDFRQIMGPNDIRSTKFDILVKGDQVTVNGTGWGHGVGMCQWGAYGMAQQGKLAEQIVQFYYPGTVVTTINKIKDKL